VPVGAPVWFDLSSSDPAVSRAFYEGLFGWTAHDTPPDFGGYVNFYKGDAMIAGMTQNPGQGAPDGWTTYLKSDDAAATADAITAAGGTVLFPPTAVMSDTDDFKYKTLKVDDVDYAGIMDGSAYLPKDVPSAWEVYIGVDDVDASVARAVELGGTVLQAAEDAPFGRIAKIADPTGGTIKLSSLSVA